MDTSTMHPLAWPEHDYRNTLLIFDLIQVAFQGPQKNIQNMSSAQQLAIFDL
jgi:hypothetical protein